MITAAVPTVIFATPIPYIPYTTTANVNMRGEPTTDSAKITLIPKNTVVWVSDVRDYDWFAVSYGDYTGYMKAEFLAKHEPEPITEPTPAAEPEPIPYQELNIMESAAMSEASAVFAIETNQPASVHETFITTANVNLRSMPTTDSDRITLVSRGNKVIVTDKRDGDWYGVEVNGRAGYMKAEFLIEEGRAHELNIASTSIGTVELLEWDEAKKIFRTGITVQIIDVRTRITYNVKSFSNGRHADVETITAADTEAFKRTYNNRWSWDTRPILVVIGERVLAASINGMPHGGGTISGNGMNGQVCIHFRGSRTHNGSKVHERDHQNSITEAFNTASKW
jgi:uncharacterized protein YgiM (DUF1202 family)